MNSEELEKSLRDEFESYLKDVLAGLDGEIKDFQSKLDEKLEKQKIEMEALFKDFSQKITSEKEIDSSFSETVAEHLKLARDDGAKITAAAVAEAEEIRAKESTASPVDFSAIRDAISEISSKNSQSEILKSLVHHSSQFTPRGAFFIVKNKHLVGWKLFGSELIGEAERIKEVHFPLNSDTSLGESIETHATIESSFGLHEGDSVFLEPLGFDKPTNIYAIPLVVRGRGVAVIYADRGSSGSPVNVEAIETLVRVSGLTVELLASSSKTDSGESKKQVDTVASDSYAKEEYQERAEVDNSYGTSPTSASYSPGTIASLDSTQQESLDEVGFQQPADLPSVNDTPSDDSGLYVPKTNEYLNQEAEIPEIQSNYEPEPIQSEQVYEPNETTPGKAVPYDSDLESKIRQETEQASEVRREGEPDFSFKSSTEAETPASDLNFQEGNAAIQGNESIDTASSGYEFESTGATYTPKFNDDYYDGESGSVAESGTESIIDNNPPSFETEPMDDRGNVIANNPTGLDAGYGLETNSSYNEPAQVETPTPVHTPEPSVAGQSTRKTRFGDRNVDLPINVEEDERRYHNDARRFARLLVSEIKLYNEQKVREGRQSGDLYERLREAVDRSREMYDKRVQPPVAAKFDYFNYELVNTLADGDEKKLGAGYPGASV